MYTKLEIVEIFHSAKGVDDFQKILDGFLWLFENGFEQKTPFYYAISQQTFRRIYKL